MNMCSAAGTGDVLKVQKLLHHCEDHYEKKESEKEGESGICFCPNIRIENTHGKQRASLECV